MVDGRRRKGKQQSDVGYWTATFIMTKSSSLSSSSALSPSSSSANYNRRRQQKRMQQSACVSSVLETFPNSVWDEAVESLLERGVATSKFEEKKSCAIKLGMHWYRKKRKETKWKIPLSQTMDLFFFMNNYFSYFSSTFDTGGTYNIIIVVDIDNDNDNDDLTKRNPRPSISIRSNSIRSGFILSSSQQW